MDLLLGCISSASSQCLVEEDIELLKSNRHLQLVPQVISRECAIFQDALSAISL